MADITISANWKTQKVRQYLDKLSPKRAGQALSTAVNDTARQVRTAAARDVAKGMGIRRKDVDDQFRIRPYSQPSTLTATVRGTGRPMPLIRFAAKQTKKGVTAKAWGQRKTYPGAFIARMQSGHTGVFHRVGDKRPMKSGRYKGRMRQPIREMWGAGVAQVMSERAIMTSLQNIGQERLLANTVRQLARYSRLRS